MEAVAPGSHGPRIPLPEAHCASLGWRFRASHCGRRTRCRDRSGSASAKRRSWHGAPCSQSIDRQASASKEGEEVVGPARAAPRNTMGQKKHPYGFRLGYNKPFKSRWYADKEYADLLHEDVKLRKELKEKLKSAGISSIDIERAANKLVVRIYTARPGIIIGRKGAEIDKLKQDVQKRTKREV